MPLSSTVSVLAFSVNENVDAVFFAFGRLRFAHLHQLLELGDGVHAVGDDLAKKNILVGI